MLYNGVIGCHGNTCYVIFIGAILEISGWFQNVPDQNTYQKCHSPHDARRSFFASRDVK